MTAPPGLRYRVATPGDVAALLQVRTAVQENHLSLQQLRARGITPAALAEALTSGTPCAWLAEVEAEVVGFSMVDLDDASLFALFVLPAHEGRGIGSHLLAEAERALFAVHPRAWLETAASSRAAPACAGSGRRRRGSAPPRRARWRRPARRPRVRRAWRAVA